MHTIYEIIRTHIQYSPQLVKLAKSDLIRTYKGAAMGWMWAIIKPTVTIAVYYIAFSIGLRVGRPINGYPYFLWIISGIVPWFYITEVFVGSTLAVRKYGYLVTKIKFPMCTIPTFVSMSHLATNVSLIGIVMIIFMGYGKMPDLYWLQIPLYILMMFLFFTAWGLFAGVLSVISKDFMQLVRSSTMALFWFSGIMYESKNVTNEALRTVLLFNPVTIIVNGFRNSFINKVWFWECGQEMRNFLIAYALMCLLATWTYKKLYKYIPDLL